MISIRNGNIEQIIIKTMRRNKANEIIGEQIEYMTPEQL